MRMSSLNSIDVSVNREIDSRYDVIKAVGDKLDELVLLSESELMGLTMVQIEALSELTGVDVVAGIADEVAIVAGSDLVNLTAAQWLSILDVQAAADLIRDLTARAVTLPAGADATAEVINGVLELGVPKGYNGQDGTVGLTPVVTLSVDENYNLLYDVVYEESIAAIRISEW